MDTHLIILLLGKIQGLKQQLQAVTPEVNNTSNKKNSISTSTCLSSWLNSWGNSAVFKIFPKVNHVTAIQISKVVLFYTAGPRTRLYLDSRSEKSCTYIQFSPRIGLCPWPESVPFTDSQMTGQALSPTL